MAWGEIKYAINSTLGTDDFAPLNKIIINSKTIIPATNELFYPNLKYEELAGEQEEKEIAKFRMFLKGKFGVRINTTLYKTATSTSYTPTVRLYVNNTLRGSKVIHSYSKTQTSTSGQNYDTIFTNVTANDDDVVKIIFLTTDDSVSSSSRCVFNNIALLGNIVETVAFDE